MLDLRIYRAALLIVAFAVMVFAFSLQDEPGGLRSPVVPQAFNGGAVNTAVRSLIRQHETAGAPGSSADQNLATYVHGQLAAALKLSPDAVSVSDQQARTVDGSRTVQTVSATEPGLTSGVIAIVAPRDAASAAAPAEAQLSATAVLIQLAAVIHAQSLHHSVEFISTSGTIGNAGTAQLAAQLAGQPVDAVLVLGDLAARNPSQPVVVPWSNGDAIAPPELRNTIAAALGSQAGVRSRNSGIPAQLARLAFPMTISAQGPFAGAGLPAVFISLSGERGPQAGEALAPLTVRAQGVGAAVLAAIDALDASRAIPPPSRYLTLNAKIVPYWAIRLLVLALLLPVLGVSVDGVARARRRGYTVTRWAGWVLAGAVPFLLGALLVMLAGVTGVISAAPPGPVGAGVVPLGTIGVIVLVLAAIAVVAAFGLLRPRLIDLAARAAGEGGGSAALRAGECAGPVLLLIAGLVALWLWRTNPFAAALLVPALHLWLWVVDPDVRTPRSVAVLLVLIGLVPPGLIIGYYVHAFGLSPSEVIWHGALLIAGGHLGPVVILAWSVMLGCLTGAIVIGLSARSAHGHDAEPVTVRGPVTYAGPGSLGGTESALRR